MRASQQGTSSPRVAAWPSRRIAVAVSAALLTVTSAVHAVTYFGGPVISRVKVVQVLWGSGTYLHFVSNDVAPDIGTFYSAVTNSGYMDGLVEYNTPDQSIRRGTFVARYQITPAVVSAIDDAQIGKELQAQIAAGHLPQPDPDTLYSVHFPFETSKLLVRDGKVLCSTSTLAWHGTTGGVGGGSNITYLVLPDVCACQSAPCPDSQTWSDAQTVRASHELVEAITDPAVGLAPFPPTCPVAWGGTSEIADSCVGQNASITGNDGVSYVVQKYWSNQQKACSFPGATISRDFSLAVSPCSAGIDPGGTATFTIRTAQSVGANATISLGVSQLLTGLSVSSIVPATISGGQTATLTIRADASAPAGSMTFLVTATGTLPNGSQDAHVAAALITISSKAAPHPIGFLGVPARIGGGNSFSAQVQMDAAAPSGGITVALTSSNPSAASLPASVNVPAGATVSAPFTVTTGIVSSSTSVTLTATYQGRSTNVGFYVDPPVYQGYHDTCDCYTTSGWAWDANRPATPINVDIYVDGSKVGTVLANFFRQDLVNAGIGNGYHGFGYNLPSWVRAGSHTVTAKYGGTQTNLGTTPKSITCESASIVWIQPQTTAGFGPPGSLIVAGHAQNAPSGTGVSLYWRDVTAGGGWNLVGYAPPPDSTHTWYNSFPANFAHVYSVYVVYDAVNTSGNPCTYAGNNTINWCP